MKPYHAGSGRDFTTGLSMVGRSFSDSGASCLRLRNMAWLGPSSHPLVRGNVDQIPDSIFKQPKISRGAKRPRFSELQSLRRSGGRREGWVHAAPAVSCAHVHRECAHEHTGSAETLRPTLRNGFTAYSALSPVTGFLATVACENNSRQLDASIGA